MALMPKRVKYRKSQRGRIRGNARRGNTVSFGDWGLAVARPGARHRRDDRSLPRGRESIHSRRGEALHPHFPAKVGNGPPAGNTNGQGQGRARPLGRGRQARHGDVRVGRRPPGHGPRMFCPGGLQAACAGRGCMGRRPNDLDERTDEANDDQGHPPSRNEHRAARVLARRDARRSCSGCGSRRPRKSWMPRATSPSSAARSPAFTRFNTSATTAAKKSKSKA